MKGCVNKRRDLRRSCCKHLVSFGLGEDGYAYTEEHGKAQQNDDLEWVALRNEQEQDTGCDEQRNGEQTDDDADQ